MIDLTKQYFLLLFDVKNSSGLKNEEFNKRMKLIRQKLDESNAVNSKQIVIPMSISYGDEIAGLYTSPENFFTLYSGIRKIFYPITAVRMVVVKGYIAVDSYDIRQIGGFVFKTANEAMNILKKEKSFFAWQTGQPVFDKSLDSLCEISNVMLNDLSTYQRDIYELINEGFNQKQIAERLGKYSQSVWNAIKRGKINYILQAQNSIIFMLKMTKW